MATAWVRSLSCRSYGVADAAVAPSPGRKSHALPPAAASCAAAEVRDTVASARRARTQLKPPRRERRTRAEQQYQTTTTMPRPHKKKPKKQIPSAALFMPSPVPAAASSAFLTMAELPGGHSSRRVVELIFSSGWPAAGAPEVEAMFRVHGAARAVARFEEARAAARARGAAARCGADGNEMMRFQCRPAGSGGVFGAGVATCRLGPAGSAVRTFACSGAAHAHASAASPSPPAGRRAMLVCRVIAGRVRAARDDHSQYDSVDMGGGELVVLDSRAVLPCFLIIYKV